MNNQIQNKYLSKLDSLGAFCLTSSSNNPVERLQECEKLISMPFPEECRSYLLKYGATVIFKELICYTPQVKTPFDRPDGTLKLEALYGLEKGDESLESNFICYKDRMPQLVIPIGAAPGGNQICMDLSQNGKTPIYYWDHEGEREMVGQAENDYGNMVQIFSSLTAFIEALKVEEEEDCGDSDVRASEIWLDF